MNALSIHGPGACSIEVAEFKFRVYLRDTRACIFV